VISGGDEQREGQSALLQGFRGGGEEGQADLRPDPRRDVGVEVDLGLLFQLIFPFLEGALDLGVLQIGAADGFIAGLGLEIVRE
jgi:hypothetical protein